MIPDKNPVLLNVSYIRPNKAIGLEESFEVIYLDDSGEVRKSNEEALAEIMFVKPELRNFDYHKPQERIENLYPVRVPISEIKMRIAKEIGPEGEAFIRGCFLNKDYKALDKVFGWKYCFRADFLPEFYFMKDWYDKYPLKDVKLHKAFIDIETDLMDYMPDMENISQTAFAPINCVSVIMEHTRECCVFILNPYNPGRLSCKEEDYLERYRKYENQLKQHESLMNRKEEFLKKLNEEFDPVYGKFQYRLKNFDNEIDLIADVFKFINDRKPYFCLAWNMRFDLQYIYNRIMSLGYDPVSIICHPDFEYPSCYFKIDNSTFMIPKQYDFFKVSSYTQYLCQMRLYAAIRKSQHTLKGYSLNAIADAELKDKKIDYSDETNIINFPYLNWEKFIRYNIKDSLLAYGIENKCRDVDTYYLRANANLTPYSKIFRETYLLRNIREQSFNKQGWVQGNSVNAGSINREDLFYNISEDDEIETSFKGAIMADPKMNARTGMEILGTKSDIIFSNAIDFDMSSFYPSNKIASNMDPDTMLYKAIVNKEDFISGECHNKSLNTQYIEKDKNGKIREIDITGQIIHTYAGKNILTFGFNYMNLPSISELYAEVMKVL